MESKITIKLQLTGVSFIFEFYSVPQGSSEASKHTTHMNKITNSKTNFIAKNDHAFYIYINVGLPFFWGGGGSGRSLLPIVKGVLL